MDPTHPHAQVENATAFSAGVLPIPIRMENRYLFGRAPSGAV
ncbi:MAG: hypothetical protein ACOX52_12950 [Verrucomicrobiota bacterium]|jgi:hypothetical protein